MRLEGRIYAGDEGGAKLFRVTAHIEGKAKRGKVMHIVTGSWGSAAFMATHMLPSTGMKSICFEEIKLPEESVCGNFIGPSS